jgi:LacI family transcriptional regulator
MDDLGYQPSQIARSLVKKQTNTIGVIMPDIKNTFFNSWFRYIEDYAIKHNFNLLLSNTDENPVVELKYVKLLISQRVDGILIVANSPKSIEYLQKNGVQFISVDRVFENLNTDYVTTDHYQGAFAATEHLISLGHKKIAVLKGPGIIFPDTERYGGFNDAMKKHQIPVDQNLILNCEFDEIKAYNAVVKLLKQQNKATAIFAFNSLMMIGTVKAIKDLNKKIPNNISLICFDEIPGFEIFQPKMTCVFQPVEQLGNESIKLLIDKIRHPKITKKKILLKPALIIGESCKKI